MQGGFSINETHLTGREYIGFALYVLHHNAEPCPEPFDIQPERWLGGEEGRSPWLKAQLKEVERDLIPFSV